MIEAFAAQGADPAFRNGVRARCVGVREDADVGAACLVLRLMLGEEAGEISRRLARP